MINDLPKAELHLHSDGVLDRRMLADLAAAGHELPLGPVEFARLCPVKSKRDWLTRYIERVEPLLAPGDLWQARLVAQYVKRAIEQNITYLEVMVSGLLYIRDANEGRALAAYKALRAAAEAAAAGRLKVEFLAPIARGPRERMVAQASRVLALHAAHLICGVFVAGEEDQCDIADIKDLMGDFRTAGMGVEIHAGEWRGPESVRDALDNGRPDRLGHAVAAFRDPELLKRIKKEGVHIEFCPTSNVVFGAVKKIEDHPIRKALDLGLSFSINTDDPGPLDITLNGEFGLAEKTFGFTKADLETVYKNAMRARFEGR